MQNDLNARTKRGLIVQSLVDFFICRKKSSADAGIIESNPSLTEKKVEVYFQFRPLGRRTIRRHRFKPIYSKNGRRKQREYCINPLNHYEELSDMLNKKAQHLMETKKRYTDPSINLEDFACELGTNRTYMSRVINEKHKKRFNCYVNCYRFNELKSLLDQYPNLDRAELASRSGFNSVSTMTRVIKEHTGLTFRKWRQQYVESSNDDSDEKELQEL